MKKFAIELGMFITAFKILIPLLYVAADDKKNKDELLLQLAAYTARRVEWESFNPYRLDDMAANIKTVTAETSLLDKIEQLLTDIAPRTSNSHQYEIILDIANLFGTSFNSDLENKYDSSEVKRGVYKGWDKLDRDLFKLFIPYHNTYEQIYGSKNKRRYYENQIMRIEND